MLIFTRDHINAKQSKILPIDLAKIIWHKKQPERPLKQ